MRRAPDGEDTLHRQVVSVKRPLRTADMTCLPKSVTPPSLREFSNCKRCELSSRISEVKQCLNLAPALSMLVASILDQSRLGLHSRAPPRPESQCLLLDWAVKAHALSKPRPMPTKTVDARAPQWRARLMRISPITSPTDNNSTDAGSGT